jgi:UDP-N-acetylmuramoyl-L-alanyl-D-glutamate--2,6-diaminopimelate ligase
LKDFEVCGISCNSKDVAEGFVFVAIRGNRADGNEFIEEALSSGARVVVAEGRQPESVKSKQAFFVTVKNSRSSLAELVNQFYARPTEAVKVVGVTGTNGKTTITYLVEAISREAGFNPAVIGTINHRFKDTVIPSKNTTPGPVELLGMLSRMRDGGVRYCAMEVSSHALDQDRVQGIKFAAAIFTNLTQDHLDYHKTFAQYFKAKAKLFMGLDHKSFAVINSDDVFGKKLIGLTKAKVITYGIDSKADVAAVDVRSGVGGTEFTVVSSMGKTQIKSGLIGKHNVYNILAAFAWAQKEGVHPRVIKSAIEKFTLVPGRLERVDCAGGYSVFVDYAHTDDALKNIIQSLRQVGDKRIIVVFGCGGERDRGKRPKMGRVASELSDYAIITSDNPRSEDPMRIIEDIKKGIKKDNFCVIPERIEAIRKSLSMAAQGDIVLVAGKGHEDYQIIGNKTLRFDDREAVKECLKSLI